MGTNPKKDKTLKKGTNPAELESDTDPIEVEAYFDPNFVGLDSDSIHPETKDTVLRSVSSEFIRHRFDGHTRHKKEDAAAGVNAANAALQSTKIKKLLESVSGTGAEIPESAINSLRSSTQSQSSATGTSGLEAMFRGGIHDDYDVRTKEKATSRKPSVHSLAGGATSWEIWWIKSHLWKRKIVFQMLLFFIFAMMQLVAGIVFLGTRFNRPDPYVCHSRKCRELAIWANSSRDEDVDPCDNFYDFVCGKHSTGDKGDMKKFWYENFARLEHDGTTLLGDILEETNHAPDTKEGMTARLVMKYYRTCLEHWHRKKTNMPQAMAYLMNQMFYDFDLWDKKKQPGLEMVASRLIEFTGDYGFFKVMPPRNHPFVIISEFTFVKHITFKNVQRYLPMIYDALHITDKKQRAETTSHLIFMGDTLESLIAHGLPKVPEEANDPKFCDGNDQRDKDVDLKWYFDLHLPFYIAYYGIDEMDIKDPKEWTHKDKKTLQLSPWVYDGTAGVRNLHKIINCWNLYIKEKIPEEYIRPVYATFWSLRLLLELIHDVDDTTAEEYKMNDRDNNFFTVFQNTYYGRQTEARCFESVQYNLGYLPVFRYFQDKIVPDYLEGVNRIINESATALLEQFRPAEEGGTRWVSSRYRERATRLLSGQTKVIIHIPIKEDDPSYEEDPKHENYTLSKLQMTDDHMENVFHSRIFTTKRTFHYWHEGSSKEKLIWYRDFYMFENVEADEAPAEGKYYLLKFPASLFVTPYWQTDFLMADYAGARGLVAKAWMKLVTFDYENLNIEDDIFDRIANKQFYREGIITDGDFEPCEVLTYGWNYDDPESDNVFHRKAEMDTHFLSFRYGLKSYPEFHVAEAWEEKNAIFPTSLAVNTMFNKYFEHIRRLKHTDYWTLSRGERRGLVKRRLWKHEQFTPQQLFFILSMRDICRSKDVMSSRYYQDNYYNHITENLAGFMQMSEFSRAWHCPPFSGMNHPNQCYRNCRWDESCAR